MSFPIGRRWVLCGILVVYAVLAWSVAATKLPYNDEGWFNLTAQEFLLHGNFATPLVETAQRTWSHIDQRNYMILPGYPILVAGWFELTGPGLIASRVFSILCGALSIFCLYTIVWRMLGSRRIAMAAAAVLALDYPFLAVAANARMDMPCLTLGLAGIAFYLAFRQRNLTLAIGVSETLAAASGLTHVNGVVCFAALHIAILHFDARRIRPQHVLVAILPYAILGGLYARFVLQDLPEFRAQFGTQSAGRLREIWHPSEIWYGFKEGVLDSFGLAAIGSKRAIQFNVAALLAYAAGVIGLLASPKLRRLPNMSALLWMMAAAVIWLTLHRSTVSQLYVVFLTPFLTVPLAICLAVKGRIWWGWFAVLGILSFAGTANRVRQDDRQNFNAAVEFLRSSPLRTQGIFASGEFGFPMGRMPQIVDDNLLGFYSGKKAGLIVMDLLYTEATTDWAPTGERDRPAFNAFRTQLLDRNYELVFHNAAYRIFGRRLPLL